MLQADKDKKVKKKKAPKEEAPAEEAPAPAAAAGDRQSSRGSRKAKRTGSNVFSMFSQKQVAEFKEVSGPTQNLLNLLPLPKAGELLNLKYSQYTMYEYIFCYDSTASSSQLMISIVKIHSSVRRPSS